MQNKFTIGYLRGEIYRMPFHMNESWNAKVEACTNNAELLSLIVSEATISEKDYLLSIILTANVASGSEGPIVNLIPKRY